MNSAPIKEIAVLLSEYTGSDPNIYSKHTKIYHDAGLYGSDFVEFLDDFSNKWQVDLRGFPFRDYTPDEISCHNVKSVYNALTIEDLASLSNFDRWEDWRIDLDR